MIAGTVYGVVLNDRAEREKIAGAFSEPPYKAPPKAPVLYIKPRNTFNASGAPVALAADLEEVEAAATLGLFFGRDAAKCDAASALMHVSAACLALDVCEPQANYYRPAIRQRCRDGFLPLGSLAPFDPTLLAGEIVTSIDGKEVHSWLLSRLVRDAAALIADVSAFMTLAAGDLLLVGLPHDAPRAKAGQRVAVACKGLAILETSFVREDAR